MVFVCLIYLPPPVLSTMVRSFSVILEVVAICATITICKDVPMDGVVIVRWQWLTAGAIPGKLLVGHERLLSSSCKEGGGGGGSC